MTVSIAAIVAVIASGFLAQSAVLADDDPSVIVETYRQFMWEGDLCRLLSEGLLVNQGPGPAGDIEVKMTALDADGAVLGSGYGSSWLGVLAPGETGPFSSTTSQFDCGATVAEVRFDITATAALDDRYRRFASVSEAVRDHDGVETLFGEVVNTGTMFVNSGDMGSRVYVGFLLGDQLVELAAAKRPVVNAPGPIGQPHPPGFRLPWSAVAPDAKYDRWVVWITGTPYPPDRFPVAVGIRDLKVDPIDQGVSLSGVVYNCGAAAASDVVLVAVARSDDGGVERFAVAGLGNDEPIEPGAEVRFAAEWADVTAGTAPTSIEVHPLSMQTQASNPGLVPCNRLADRLTLPALRVTRSGSAHQPRSH